MPEQPTFPEAAGPPAPDELIGIWELRGLVEDKECNRFEIEDSETFRSRRSTWLIPPLEEVPAKRFRRAQGLAMLITEENGEIRAREVSDASEVPWIDEEGTGPATVPEPYESRLLTTRGADGTSRQFLIPLAEADGARTPIREGASGSESCDALTLLDDGRLVRTQANWVDDAYGFRHHLMFERVQQQETEHRRNLRAIPRPAPSAGRPVPDLLPPEIRARVISALSEAMARCTVPLAGAGAVCFVELNRGSTSTTKDVTVYAADGRRVQLSPEMDQILRKGVHRNVLRAMTDSLKESHLEEGLADHHGTRVYGVFFGLEPGADELTIRLYSGEAGWGLRHGRGIPNLEYLKQVLPALAAVDPLPDFYDCVSMIGPGSANPLPLPVEEQEQLRRALAPAAQKAPHALMLHVHWQVRKKPLRSSEDWLFLHLLGVSTNGTVLRWTTRRGEPSIPEELVTGGADAFQAIIERSLQHTGTASQDPKERGPGAGHIIHRLSTGETTALVYDAHDAPHVTELKDLTVTVARSTLPAWIADGDVPHDDPFAALDLGGSTSSSAPRTLSLPDTTPGER